MNYNFQGKLDCERHGIKNEFQLFLTQIGPIFWSKKGTNMELLKKYFYFQLIKKSTFTENCSFPPPGNNPIKTSFLALVIAPVPFLTPYSFYEQVMLILILIDFQYLQKVISSFEKGSNGQN